MKSTASLASLKQQYLFHSSGSETLLELYMCLFYTVVYSSAKPHTVERVQWQQGVSPTSTFVQLWISSKCLALFKQKDSAKGFISSSKRINILAVVQTPINSVTSV